MSSPQTKTLNLERDLVVSASDRKCAGRPVPNRCPGQPADLEAYLDFLEAVEAFSSPKPDPVWFDQPFEL